MTEGALALVAVGGVAFFVFVLFPVSLALASQLVPAGQTGAATGVVFGVSGLMTAISAPVVGVLGEAMGDIRMALAWLLPLAVLGVVLAMRIEHGSAAERAGREAESSTVPADRDVG